MDKFEQRKEDFLKIAKELAEQFYKKNKDYNDSYFNLDKQGFPIDNILSEVDFYVQLRRKFSRLANFAEKRLKNQDTKNLVDDETEEDTIRDIGIYCVMELIKRKNKMQNDETESHRIMSEAKMYEHILNGEKVVKNDKKTD